MNVDNLIQDFTVLTLIRIDIEIAKLFTRVWIYESVHYNIAGSFYVDRTRFIMAIILFWRGGNRQKSLIPSFGNLKRFTLL